MGVSNFIRKLYRDGSKFQFVIITVYFLFYFFFFISFEGRLQEYYIVYNFFSIELSSGWFLKGWKFLREVIFENKYFTTWKSLQRYTNEGNIIQKLIRNRMSEDKKKKYLCAQLQVFMYVKKKLQYVIP